jgi:predicted  nucleic acid-binding Zn-ribbon protein
LSTEKRIGQYEENVKKIKNEIDIFRSQRLQVQNNLDGAPPAAQFSDYATKDELDTARADNTKDVEGVLGVIEAECEKLRNAAQTTEKQLEQLMTQFSSIKENGKDLNGQLEATVNELKQEGHNTKGELAQVTKELDVVKTSTKDILAQLVDFRTSYMQKLEGKISTDVVHLAKNSAEHEARLEGLAMAVQHCDERLSQWSTKDYYDKVVNRLSQLNPNWFATCTKVTQLSDQVAGLNVKLASMSQSFTTNFSSVSKTVQLLKDHQEKINITAAIPPIVPSNVNGHPPGSFDEISEKLEFFKSEIKDLNARLEADTNMHDKHANDLQEWAGLVEVKVREAIETVARLEDEIRAMQSGELRNHGPAPETGLEPETEPGHHLQPGHQVQIGIEDRWKAVSVSTSAREEPRTSQDLDL